MRAPRFAASCPPQNCISSSRQHYAPVVPSNPLLEWFLMLALALLLLTTSSAFAVCVPALTSAENGTDACDDDDDGSLAVRRAYINTMNVPPAASGFDFNIPSGAVTIPAGVVQIVQGGGHTKSHLETVVVSRKR